MFASFTISPTEISGHVTCVVFTYGCAGICDYCYNRELWKPKSDNQVSSQEILDYIDCHNRKYHIITAVSITGAEPLTCVDDIRQFTIDVFNRRLFVNLDTSLTQGFIEDLLPFLSRVSITVKSVWPLYTSYVETNLRHIEQAGIPTEVRLVFTKVNVPSIIHNFQWLIKKFAINIKSLVVRPAVVTETNQGKFEPITLGEYQDVVEYIRSLYGGRYDLRVVEM